MALCWSCRLVSLQRHCQPATSRSRWTSVITFRAEPLSSRYSRSIPERRRAFRSPRGSRWVSREMHTKVDWLAGERPMTTLRATLWLVLAISSLCFSSPAAAQSCQGRGWEARLTSRANHAMAYDSARGVTVLFGGYGRGVETTNTWEWDGSTWALGATSGPSARSGAAMAYDSARGVMVLFGGMTGSSYDAATWEWDGS